jgi:hypothetical protein
MASNTNPPTWAKSLNNAKKKANFWRTRGAAANNIKEQAEKKVVMNWDKKIKNGEKWKNRGAAANDIKEQAEKKAAMIEYNKAITLWNVKQPLTNKDYGLPRRWWPWGGNYTHKRKRTKRNRTKRNRN